MSERLLGASVRRREDARLVTGRGRYVADVALPGMLHVAVHRSPHAHARLVKVDAEAARRRPGVVQVLLPADAVALGRLPLLVPHASLSAPACAEILPREVVSYAGQPVAVVVAESAAEASDALEALRVEYQPLPPVATPEDALRPDGPRVHPGGNVAALYTQRVGDPAGEPPVAQSPHPTIRGLRAATDPDRQAPALRWLRLHAHRDDAVVPFGDIHLGVAPARAEQSNGVVHPRAARVEVLAEGLVFRLLPAHAHAEPNASARQRVERAHLLGHQHRLALGKHQHLRAERHS